MRILVADDDPVSLRLMEHMLQNSGYKVITVDNGQEAASVLSKAGGPRLALIDWMMPGLDGPGVCRAVRGRHDDAYVYMLLLTSKQSSGDVVQGLEAGADDYLTKPCHPAECTQGGVFFSSKTSWWRRARRCASRRPTTR